MTRPSTALPMIAFLSGITVPTKVWPGCDLALDDRRNDHGWRAGSLGVNELRREQLPPNTQGPRSSCRMRDVSWRRDAVRFSIDEP